MSTSIVLFVSLGYIGLLFLIAALGEKFSKQGKKLVRNPLVYSLSLAVYCTAWTYYGSVGKATESGLEFLPIYLGPVIIAPLWVIILRKMIVIAKSERISSIADFVSARYGKSAFLGGLVSLIAIAGTIPYIALQLKAISSSFSVLTQQPGDTGVFFSGLTFYQDTAFYITIFLAIFTILFGTRHVEVSGKQTGLVTTIAFESIIKLIAFLAVGLFVCFGLFDSPADLFQQANERAHIRELWLFEGGIGNRIWTWLWLILISMMAILFLPRQFHISVVENQKLTHVNSAIWIFPLYLFLINLFVLPIAFGGMMVFEGQAVEADTFVLNLPLSQGKEWLALLVFIGGLSASTSMVIVATNALSIMASNNLLVPLLIRSSAALKGGASDISGTLQALRRLIIVVILFLAYTYFTSIGKGVSLVSIGLVSFVAAAQFAPSMLGGLFWRGGNHTGVTVGLVAGFCIWAYTLPIPALLENSAFGQQLIHEGLFGWEVLKPFELFGLSGLDPISHAAFWSLFINTTGYIIGSLYSKPTAIGHAQANLFVGIYRYTARHNDSALVRGKAPFHDIRLLLNRFLGYSLSEEMLNKYAARHDLDLQKLQEANPDLVAYAEKLLVSVIGSSSARVLIGSIVKEEPINLFEVMNILDETQQLMRYSQELEQKSTELERTSQELKLANDKLREMDLLKDEFITTVTHELRTPITSIRSFSNILLDNPDLEEGRKQEFLAIVVQESKRISRLINQILDLEKMESGHADWNISEVDLTKLIPQSVRNLRTLIDQNRIVLTTGLPKEPCIVIGDQDRLMQVFINLLSNAIKFCNPEEGEISVRLDKQTSGMMISVTDNGIGISPEVQPYIFDKFTQFTDHTTGRKQGSGLGLSITSRIVQVHKGTIEVESTPGQGTTFRIYLPVLSESQFELIETKTTS